ncbi:YqaJ viral recombinase family nuclease [Brachybacterium tyrofermentans]|uniref:YqaJ viral recombinase family nuclease n=1 Tax=Brachybacterium tyrofermentans TaxID=47848 RepID=UPI0018666854|nr:YqaJ viral recombinase family protein [Brachybacterium tyrofermentans]
MTATAQQILRAAADGTEEWKNQRTEGFGGSNAADLHTGSASRFALWREKVGLAEPEVISPELQAMFDFGHSREPALARIFTERTGLKVRNTGTWARKDQPWQLANPDRLIGRDGILEIKTTGAYTDAAKDWKAGIVPAKAWVQNHWYAHVTGRTQLWFIAEVDRQPIILGPFDRDEQLIEDLVLEATEFWEQVTAGAQPEPTTPGDMPLAYPTSVDGSTVELEPWDDTVQDLQRLTQLQAQIKELSAEEKDLRASIQSEMGDAEQLISDGRVLATWKTTNGRKSLSKDALQEDGIDTEKYMRQGKSYRRFTVKGA